MEIQITIRIFILQDSRATKLGWKEIYNEMWCEKIMLVTPQRFSAVYSSYKLR